MLTIELVNNNIPRLQLTDSVAKGLQLLNDFRLTHLPVISEEVYLGLISEEDLLDCDDDRKTIEMLQDHFMKESVADNVHFLNAVNFSTRHETSIVPVTTGNNEYAGVIPSSDLLKTLSNFAGGNEIGGIIVLEMERSQFGLSEIGRIVESNDCTVLHLNTIMHPETGLLTVTLHINKREISAVVSTFERYDYDVIYFYGNEKFENEIHTNYRHLMNYLDL